MGNPLKKIEPWIDPIGNQGQKAIANATGLGADPKSSSAGPAVPSKVGQYTPAPLNPYLTGQLRAAPPGGPTANPSAPATGAGYTPNYWQQNPSAGGGPPATPPTQGGPITNIRPNIPQGPPLGGAPNPIANVQPNMPPPGGQPPPQMQPQPMPQAPINTATGGQPLFNPAIIAGLRGR